MIEDLGRPIGIVVGETTPLYVEYLSREPPRLGNYVIIEHPEGYVLGMVEKSISGHVFLPEDSSDIEAAFRTIEMIGDDRQYMRGIARILSRLEDLLKSQKVRPMKTPPRTGSKVYEATEKILREILVPKGEVLCEGDAIYDDRTGRGFIRVGTLASAPSVPVYVDVTKMVARHAAILAMTGAGKSNTVAVIADRISRAFKGTVIIFDTHGEYLDAFPSVRPNVITPRINPNALKLSEIATLSNIYPSYHKQYRVLRLLYKAVYDLIGPTSPGKNYIEMMLELVDMLDENEERLLDRPIGDVRAMPQLTARDADTPPLRGNSDGELAKVLSRLARIKRDYVYEVAGKLEDLLSKYRNFLDVGAPKGIRTIIEPGRLNIVDLTAVDIDGSDVFISYVTRTLLDERKRFYATKGREGYEAPVFIILEEAHILVPRGEEETNTKRVFAQIAREGRKFGVGICLVSQRPKNLDENSLSQTNNKIILKLIEPEDQGYVQRTSEQLSKELLELLASLDVGEAIMLGEFTTLPVLVKIDEHKHKRLGRDPDIVREWVKVSERERRVQAFFDEFSKMQYGL